MNPVIDILSVGKRIRFYRIQRGWTIPKLANETGISERHLGHIERGERACSLNALIQIANAFKIPTDELLVDNLVASSSKRDGEEYYILLDCTQDEATILIQNMQSLKEILRKYKIS